MDVSKRWRMSFGEKTKEDSKEGTREESSCLYALREADPRTACGDPHPSADEAGVVYGMCEERVVKQND